jgi:membrane-associated phospholipid phosphatase
LTRAGLLALAALTAFAGLAVLAAGADGRLIGDGLVMDVLNGIAPVSSDDVHIDPVLEVTTVVVIALVALLVLWRLARRDLRGASFLVVGVTAPVLLSRVVKELVARPAIEGPPAAYTFPSGSATWCAATVVAVALIAAAPTERRIVALAGTALTLLYSAIIAWEEWHHPSDVLAGWCLGSAGAATAWIAFGRPTASTIRAG